MRIVTAAVSAAVLLLGVAAPAAATTTTAATPTRPATAAPWAPRLMTKVPGVAPELLRGIDHAAAAQLSAWVDGRRRAGLPAQPKRSAGAGGDLVISAKDGRTGQPVAGVCVTAFVDGPIEVCGEGHTVTLPDLPAGRVGVLVRAEPERFYLPDFAVVTVLQDQPGAHTAALKLGGVVTTTVTARETGEPISSGASILLRAATATGGFDLAEPGPDGDVRSPALPPGQYRMFAVADPASGLGHQWVGSDSGTGQERFAAIVTVRAGEASAAPTLRLDPAGSINGTVIAPDGNPAPEVFVAVESLRYFDLVQVGMAVSNEDGQYEIPNLGPYDWGFRFTSLAEVGTFADQWTGGVARAADASTVRIRPGATRELTTRTARGTALHGTATAGTAEGLRLISFVEARTGEVLGFSAGSATDPKYSALTLGGNAVKAFGLTFAESGELLLQGWHDNAADFGQAAVITVPHRDAVTADLKFPQTGPLARPRYVGLGAHRTRAKPGVLTSGKVILGC